ncbi:MAG: TolC family protein, partial [Vicinamibacterales bacterium]
MHRHLRLFGLVCSSALLVAARAEAQQAAAAPVVLTLARALDLAIPASEALTAAQASLRQADAQRRVARSGLFPQVSASASYLRTLETEFAGVFDRFPQDGATGG